MKWTPKKIKALRVKKGMTQESFAKVIGVTIVYLSYLENGKRNAGRTLQLLLDVIASQASK